MITYHVVSELIIDIIYYNRSKVAGAMQAAKDACNAAYSLIYGP